MSGNYQEHALVKTIRGGLADQIGSAAEVILSPAMLDSELAQSLGPCQRRLNAVNAALEVVLRLVEDLLGLEDLQDSLLALEGLLGEEELGELLDGDVALGALLGEKLVALGTRGLEGLDPVGSGYYGGHVGGYGVARRGTAGERGEKSIVEEGES